MNDSLIRILNVEQPNTGFSGGAARCQDEILATGHEGVVTPPGEGIHNVVHRTKGVFLSTNLTTALEEAI